MEACRKQVAILGIDLAKRVFALHGVDASGATAMKKVVSRSELTLIVAKLPPCLIGLESCSGAHEWARRFQQFGHTVRLIAPAFVTPYRKSGKNDTNDAEAICEAVGRPSMRFVPIKSIEQQSILTLHRARQGFVEERTALINRIRGLMTEFGHVFANRQASLRNGLAASTENLPELARQVMTDLLEHLRYLNERVGSYDRRLEAIAKQHEDVKRLLTIPGVGPTTAIALTASVGDARMFKNGRQFAAWLGLTPKQFSSGGKNKLGGITKRGNEYLRTLFVQGARAAMQRAAERADRLGGWVLSLQERRGYHKANIAMAAKNARIAWCVLARGTVFESRETSTVAA